MAEEDPSDPTLAVARGRWVVTERCKRDVLLVEGRMETSAQARVLWVGPGGRFLGSAEVEFAEIHGDFEGDLSVSKKLAVHNAGRVSGSVRYREIVIEPGGTVSADASALL